MSDSYMIDGVTVTPTGGGWYEVTHATLPHPIKEQGKENADARAAEVARGLQTAEPQADPGVMPEQGDIAAALVAAEAAETDEMAKLKEQLAAAQALAAEEQAARIEAEKKLETKTVQTDGGEVPGVASAKVPAAVPRKFEGILDDKAKAELKRLGIETTRIVLEENESIPPTGLFLGHNGRGYMIAPGEEVDVPNFLLGVLNDAVMSAPVVDSKSQKVLGYRSRMRYPYRKV